MSALRRFRALPPRERRLLFSALAAMAGARIALTLLSFRTLHRWALRPADGTAAAVPSPAETAEEVGRAVSRAGRLIPGATCLVRALAAQALLRRRGIAATVHFGVGFTDARAFQAHAWVEAAGRTVVGGGELERLTPFPHAGTAPR